jgi:hypothetical protein
LQVFNIQRILAWLNEAANEIHDSLDNPWPPTAGAGLSTPRKKMHPPNRASPEKGSGPGLISGKPQLNGVRKPE